MSFGVRCLSQKSLGIPRLLMVRQASAWHRDWKPGQYPSTEEERITAAKKYNLIPADYKPFADDGLGLGDYPNLPPIGMANRDPYERWDIPARKRNYGEPMHWMQDFMVEFLWNPNFKPPLSYTYMISFLLGAAGLMWAAVYYNPLRVPKPYKPKQYPFWKDGLPVSEDKRTTVAHYTFDPPGAASHGHEHGHH